MRLLVAKPAKEKLASEAETDGGTWEYARLGDAGLIVVDSTQELVNQGYAQEIIGIGEEAHATYHDGSEVEPLCPGNI
ncbi:hypothetical protein ACLOJK_024622 [Asimina triloba]